jgi:hypothetical protein
MAVFIFNMVSHVIGLRVTFFHQLSSAFIVIISFLSNSFEIWRLIGSLNSRSLNLDCFDVTSLSIVALKITIDISGLS